jgi:hypothetical protein
MKLSEAQVPTPKILLYGPPGGGKTVLASSLGEGCCYLDLDLNISSAKTTVDPLREERLKIDWFPYVDENPLKPARWGRFKSKVLELLNAAEQKKLQYKSVVIDSLTSAGDASLKNVLFSSGMIASDGSLKTKSGGPELSHWGLAMTELETILIWLKSMPIPVVVVAHQEMKALSENQNVIELSVIGSKLAPKVPGYFNEVWYLSPKVESGGKISYNIRTKHTGQILARSTSNLPEIVDAKQGMWKIFETMGYKRPA